MNYFFLQFQSGTPEKPERHASLKDAKAAFLEVATELAQHGQSIVATVHIAPTRYEIAEYPDYALSLGPRGGVRCTKA